MNLRYGISMRYAGTLITWLASDLLLFISAYILAYFLRVGWIFSTDFPFDRFLAVVLIVSPLWIGALVTTRTFSLTRNQQGIRNLIYILYSCAMGTALFALTYYFLYGLFFSRLLLVEALLLTVGITALWHVVFEEIRKRVLRRSPPVFPTLIVGLTRESKRLIEILELRRSPLRPIAILDGRGVPEKEVHGVPVFGKLNKLEEVLEAQHITHLIQCADLEQSLNLLSACRARGITYVLLPSVLGIVERDETVESLEGTSVTMVRPKQTFWHWFFR